MKKTLTVLLVLILLVVGLGFYRGWFVLSGSTSTNGGNKVDVHLTVDPDKAKEDAQAVQKKATDVTGKVTEGSKDVAEETNDKLNSE
jgi:hypothetical protein